MKQTAIERKRKERVAGEDGRESEKERKQADRQADGRTNGYRRTYNSKEQRVGRQAKKSKRDTTTAH